MEATDSPHPEGSFAAIGLTGESERVYRFLLHSPGLAVDKIAATLDVDAREVEAQIDELVSVGLVLRSRDGRGRPFAADPTASLSGLIQRRQLELDSLKGAVHAFQELYRASIPRDDANAVVEVLTDSDAVTRRIKQLQAGVTHEMLMFDKAPYVAHGDEFIVAEQTQLARGVEVRVIYESSVLDSPIFGPLLREMVAKGEKARMVEELPTKMILIDDRIAVTPLRLGPESTFGLCVYSAAPIIALLRQLFENTWNLGTPLSEPVTPYGSHSHGLDRDQRDLLALSVLGLKDEALARHLGVSKRTVQRRLRALMQQLDVNTRTQLAARAAQMDLLPHQVHDRRAVGSARATNT